MGQRLRLKRGYDISRFPRQARIVLQRAEALRDDPRRQRLALVRQRRAHRGWDNDDLHSLHGVPGSAFEVVDTSRLPRP